MNQRNYSLPQSGRNH